MEKTEKECQLEAELKKVEDEYKATREKVNELRKSWFLIIERKLVLFNHYTINKKKTGR